MLQPARGIMAELFGKKTGICRGQGGSMHMFSSEWGLVSMLRMHQYDSMMLASTPVLSCQHMPAPAM